MKVRPLLRFPVRLLRSLRRHPKLWLLAAAVLSFPYLWGPWIAERVARHYLDLEEPGSSRIEIDRLSLFRIKARGIRVGAVAGAPSCERLDVRYTPWGLARGRVDSVEARGLSWDAASVLPASVRGGVPHPATRADLSVEADGPGYRATLRGTLLGGPLSGTAGLDAETGLGSLSLETRPGIEGLSFPALVQGGGPGPLLRAEAEFSLAGRSTGVVCTAKARAFLPGTRWRVEAAAAAETNGAFSVSARLPETVFALDDPVVADAVRLGGAGDLLDALSGIVAGSFEAAKAPKASLPEWNAELRIEGTDASLFGPERPLLLSEGGARFRLSGYGPHADVKPFSLRFGSVVRDQLAFGRGFFSLGADDGALQLTQGSAEFCGGHLRVYALRLDPKTLDAGFTLLLDDIDAGSVLSLFPGVDGTATGRLHGKLPLSVRKGREVRLRDAFLYSPPGESGTLRLRDASGIVDPILASGVPAETCRHLRAALENLTYSVLRMDLRHDYRSEHGTLSLHIEGNGSDGALTIPVDLTVNFNGDLQKTLNLGIRASGIGKERTNP